MIIINYKCAVGLIVEVVVVVVVVQDYIRQKYFALRHVIIYKL